MVLSADKTELLYGLLNWVERKDFSTVRLLSSSVSVPSSDQNSQRSDRLLQRKQFGKHYFTLLLNEQYGWVWSIDKSELLYELPNRLGRNQLPNDRLLQSSVSELPPDQNSQRSDRQMQRNLFSKRYSILLLQKNGKSSGQLIWLAELKSQRGI